MKYYLDCEFDGYQGELLSIGLVSETDKSMYVVMQCLVMDQWVGKNVVPKLLDVPLDRISGPVIFGASPEELSRALGVFFLNDISPQIIADWPDDIKYLCAALITGPGTMINVPRMGFTVARVDAYPTKLKGAVQHNAWWDAQALRSYFVGPEYE